MVFSSILQNDEPKPKFFWNRSGTKHPLKTHPLRKTRDLLKNEYLFASTAEG